ncbi:MAG: divergent polysaccharide deacetylase family protein [Rhizobiaceae bacterium]|nr:divergent polysaccharide deacetylase family protein [Rhizobiaceae bacterium]
MQQDDLDKPLGQDLPSVRRGRRTNRIAAWGAAIGALLMVVSLAIAIREKPFRSMEPQIVASDNGAKAKGGEQPKSKSPSVTVTSGGSGGPSIIKVNPSMDGTSTGAIVITDPSALHQDLRVAHIPDRALIEDSSIGPLPIRAADGRRPFDVYARPWSGARGARVAIVIGGLGVSQTGTQSAIAALPPEVTLAFASQGNSIGRWMQEGRRTGHEVIMQVPLEPFDFPNVNPGRHTLTVSASPEENIDNLLWTLSRTTNYTGVMNYMGARFTSDVEAMQPLMSELGKRGLLYLDDGTSARSVAAQLAPESGVPFLAADAVIDAVQERTAILDKLDQLERIARAKGYAVGTGSAFGVTVEAVRTWAAEARRRGIEIVPVSALAQDPQQG